MERGQKLAIIVLNWNSARDTLRTVSTISRWSVLKPKIIIVDNGSNPDDFSHLMKFASDFQIIRNPLNLGYAGGNNAGIFLALEQGFDFILLLNSDAEISEQCVRRLLLCLNQWPDVGIIGPLLEENGRIYSGGRNIGIYSRTKIIFIQGKIQPGLISVDYVPGTVLLARREAFVRTGLLEEEFFFSGEIADFCRKMKKSGLYCAIYNGCQAIHHPEKESKIRDSLYIYYSLRNRFLFIRRNFHYVGIFLQLRWVVGGIIQIFIAQLKGRRDRAHALGIGLKDGILGRFGDRNDLFPF